MTHTIQLTKHSSWKSISVAEAMSNYRGMIDPDELVDNCIAVWIYIPEHPVALWIQELDNNTFFTVAGRDSALGNFEICAQCIADNV